jgi:hypothetical protein
MKNGYWLIDWYVGSGPYSPDAPRRLKRPALCAPVVFHGSPAALLKRQMAKRCVTTYLLGQASINVFCHRCSHDRIQFICKWALSFLLTWSWCDWWRRHQIRSPLTNIRLWTTWVYVSVPVGYCATSQGNKDISCNTTEVFRFTSKINQICDCNSEVISGYESCRFVAV